MERGNIMHKIPKIIHYCWVGGAPKPRSVIYCIESWKKYCPDYEIREWNESNYDFKKNQYMKEAYDEKKWGFVPDYARLDIIYQYGGIYLDTDVEIIKNIDSLLENEVFFGFENTGTEEYFINCGQGFGAIKQHNVIKQLRDFYDNISFYNPDGSLNMLPSPHYTTQMLLRFGLKCNNCNQNFSNITIYSSEVLCPKNFKTGKINITKATISIHHFTASWLDEKIKDELEYQKKMNSRYGEKLARKIMLIDSVLKKYGFFGTIKKVVLKIKILLKKKIVFIRELYPYYRQLKRAKKVLPGNDKIVLLNTAMYSDNLGDYIIMHNCTNQLKGLNIFEKELLNIPTHRLFNDLERKQLLNSPIKILCGTNILSGHMLSYGLWKIPQDVSPLCNTVLMGVGFSSYNNTFDRYTKKLFNTILSNQYIHSVRDSFSENMLKKMGIKNVLNTACPTMWNLTPEHCKTIPKEKGDNVICTLTDYCKDPINDRLMIEIAKESYDNVYVWIQGESDLEYLRELKVEKFVNIIPRKLESYNEILKLDNLDYIGTRLHAGIHSLNNGHRSIIIAIDNRAECISQDTGLPIIKRDEISIYLKEKIYSNFETKINLPEKNIEIWKNQFYINN